MINANENLTRVLTEVKVMSKPIKREPGSKSIPAWQKVVGSEKFNDVIFAWAVQLQSGIADVPSAATV